jgi:hypothetical protein
MFTSSIVRSIGAHRPFAFLANFMAAAFVSAALVLPAQAAKVTHVSGAVQLERDGAMQGVQVGLNLQQGDRLISASDGQTLIRFDDGAQMVLRADSDFQVQELPDLRANRKQERRAKALKLVKGGLRYISGGKRKRYKVGFETPTVSVGIRGTDIELQVMEQVVQDINPGTFLKVNSGAAELTTAEGSRVAVFAGDIAWGGEPELAARGGRAPRPAARLVRLDAGAEVFKGSSLERLLRQRP